MKAEIIVKLIIMVCETIRARTGGTGLEAQVAERVLAEVYGRAPRLAGPRRRLPGSSRRLLPEEKRLAAHARTTEPPADDDGRSWLEIFLGEAKGKGWCIDPCCTTCGAQMFRNELFTRAALHAGVDLPLPGQHKPGALVNSFDFGEAFACCREILAGMARLPRPEEGDFDLAAVRFILADIRTIFPPPLAVEQEPLRGTWVAELDKALRDVPNAPDLADVGDPS